MKRGVYKGLLGLGAFLVAVAACGAPRTDALYAVQMLRAGGCGGILPAARPLHHDALLDKAAQQWAAGNTLSAATEHSGYRAEAAAGLHVTGPESSTAQMLRRSSCVTVSNQGMRDIGIYRHAMDTWFILASADVVPASSEAPVLVSRALNLVNEARAHGTRCGEKAFAPAPPVVLSGTLGGVALGHASDMAQHDYFEH